MTVEKFRDALHDIIGEYFLYHSGKNQLLMFVCGYLNGFINCIINASSIISGEEILYLSKEWAYIRENILGWIEDGKDIQTEIKRIGWNDSENENEWWYTLHG